MELWEFVPGVNVVRERGEAGMLLFALLLCQD